MKKYIIFLLFPILLLGNNDIKKSIIKIYTTHNNYNYIEPWNASTYASSGSGVIIKNKYILTNAHVVSNNTFIEVKKHGDTKKYKANVLAISHQVDLALLKVEDDYFYNKTIPLDFYKLPQIQEEVSIYGYPTGGTMLSISSGVISRIQSFRYVHSGEKFLGIQIDAAVNPGNSGGPAIINGKIAGIVMQNMPKAQNIGYLVPVPIIKHFLNDYFNDNNVDGFPEIGILTEKLENPSLRKFYNLNKNVSGLLINKVLDENSLLKEEDVLMEISGKNIENDGTINFRNDEYTDFSYYINKKQINDFLDLKILRNNKIKNIKLKLDKTLSDFLLIKSKEYDVFPRYYIYNGYIFAPLTENLIRTGKMPREITKYYGEWANKNRQDIIILLKVLATKENQGNLYLKNIVIDKINNKKIKSYKNFIKELKNNRNDFIKLETENNYKIVIKKEDKINFNLLKKYNIRNYKSYEKED